MLLTVHNLARSFGATTVLAGVSFSIQPRERVGIVGANGSGKSTLLRILAGRDSADAGEARYATAVEIGYLPQSTPPFHGETIDDLIHESVGELRRLEERMRRLEAVLARAGEEELPPLLEEYGEVTARFQDRGGYELDHRIAAVLAGLRLDYVPRAQPVRTLSGGERARAGIAALLLRAPDLLLLDEPTNHLDRASLEWLEDYLAQYAGAAAIVSHDRQFLNRTVTRIIELDDTTHELRSYDGDYDSYARAKAAERAKQEVEYERQQEELRELRARIRETARQVGHNRPPRDNDKSAYNARAGRVEQTVSRNVRSAEERLRQLEAHPVARPPKPLGFAPRFGAARLRTRTVIVADGISKRLGGRDILRDITCVVRSDARILLTGPNGAGKTTLLRLLLGLEEPDTGTLRITPGAHVGYLPQESATVTGGRTLLDAYREGLEGPEGTLVASLLGNGLFHLDDLPKPADALSLGQRRKLEIARLVAMRPNVLALDEPTNHISLDVLEAFEAAVLAFPGPVLAVSHDRRFAQRFGGDVWELADGQLIVRSGGLPPAASERGPDAV